VRDPAPTVPRVGARDDSVTGAVPCASTSSLLGFWARSWPARPSDRSHSRPNVSRQAWLRPVAGGAGISMFGYVSGMTLAVPRALWKFAEEGLCRKSLGAIHARFRTPHVAIIVQSLLVTALAVFNSFEQLAVIANLSALLLYGAVAVRSPVLRRRDVRHQGAMPFRVPGGALVPVLTAALIASLLTSITCTERVAMIATLTLASIFYAIRSRLGAHGASVRGLPPMRGRRGPAATGALLAWLRSRAQVATLAPSR
jgi:amino acid transporter